MKNILTYLLFLGCCTMALANGSSIRVRDAFDYQAGDTLLYLHTTASTQSGPPHNSSYTSVHILLVITGRNDFPASGTIVYQTNHGTWVLNNIDSFVSFEPFQSPPGFGFDTLFFRYPVGLSDSVYRGTLSSLPCDSAAFENISYPIPSTGKTQWINYAAGIGLTQKAENNYAPPLEDFSYQLLYYHVGTVACGADPTVVMGINNQVQNEKVYIYPQISAGSITIHSELPTYSYKIINALGQCEASGEVSEQPNLEIDISHLSFGLHYISIRTKAGETYKCLPLMKE